MKILLTGATSFTGYWFAKTLAESGHELVMPIRRPPAEYEGVRRERAVGLSRLGRVVQCDAFGTDSFFDLVRSEAHWDLLAHHAAQVADYRSPDFDVAAALSANVNGFDRVLGEMAERGCLRVVATGSVFEPGEGAGSDGLPAFSPYGLSKAFSSETIRFHTRRRGLRFGKFVIPNPFGPFEEPRFTSYLMKTWASGKTASVATPEYVRDNIHVDLLAATYVNYVEQADPPDRLTPSGYVESQGRFALRIAEEMRRRLPLDCDVELAAQTQFVEPRIRIGTDPAAEVVGCWNESDSWDAFAEHYSCKHAPAPARESRR